MKKISVIIVNYNVCYFLEQAIKSVLNAINNLDAEIIVVDNNSVDGSVELVEKKFPEVKLIANKKNVGFSSANNQAIKVAQGEYVLLLNPDTVVEEDTLEKCCEFMDENPEAGGLGVKMVDGKGVFLPESKRSLPTPAVAFYKISGLANLFPRSKRFGRYHLGFLPENETNEVEVLAGAFMLIRSSALDKVGLLDEDYFMYGEDIDLSYRLIKGGYKNYYFPKARIIHYKGESTKKTSVNYVFIFYRAMVIFARKHFSRNKAKLFSFLINIAIYLRASVDIAANFFKRSAITLADISLIYIGMYFLSNYWESSYKLDQTTKFPPELMLLAVPLYITIWLLSNHFCGGNDKPIKLLRVLTGITLGTLLISAFSNFTEALRFSKALILLGGALSFAVIALNRLAEHYLKYGNLVFGKIRDKNAVLVGDSQECWRVIELLNKINAKVDVVGYLSLKEYRERLDKYHIGNFGLLEETVEIYDVDEVIFCSKDVPAFKIIEKMVEMRLNDLDFKIVPYESDYIIGSNSKNRPGDFYTIDIKLNITQKSHVRNKRLLDIGFSFMNLLLYPFLFWFVEKKWNYFKNIFRVMAGKQTWVGFGSHGNVNLPKIRKGILSPKTNYRGNKIDENLARKLDARYAKDYHIAIDLEIIFKSFSKLGG